jgi:ribonuclease-3
MDLFEQAYTHSSVTKEHSQIPNNERMEFYGDAVLKLVFSEYLYDKFPNYAEGELTKIRSLLVSDQSLLKVAHKIDVKSRIKVGGSIKKIPDSIIGNAVEAHIAAIYMTEGYDAARKFILESWTEINETVLEDVAYNYKSILQDHYQRLATKTPRYRTIDESGPDHDKHFTVGVYFEDQMLGAGSGSNKKLASMEAAKDAVHKLGLDPKV